MSLRNDLPNITLPGIPRGLLAVGDQSYVQAAAERAAADRRGAHVVLDEIGQLADLTAQGLIETRNKVDELSGKVAALQVGGVDGNGAAAPDLNKSRDGIAFAKFVRSGAIPQAAMRTDSDPDGGYTVPEVVDTTIRKRLRDTGVVRQLARSVTIGAGSEFKILVGNADSTSGWVGERETRPETNTETLNEMSIVCHELYANPAVTQRLLDDSAFDINSYLTDEIAGAFRSKEEAAFVWGDGINKPRGFLNYGAPVTTGDATRAFGVLQYVASGVAADINDSSHNGVDALISLVYSLRQPYRIAGEVGWLMNSTLAGKVRKLKNVTTGDYLWIENVMAGQPPTLLGYPVYIHEDMPNVGADTFPIAFGNWREGYCIVDKTNGTQILRDPYTNKPYVNFYTTRRVGGGLQNSEAIKLLKCASS